ncbi:TIGR04104 family putative zinc finger protein [Bacillus sp. Marseille-Q3570]|uniref:TIGR04104 family putative zinc finger protein n=1 Tax=Bacillus sp. Marseille-Q3570 TaxID=2963522 RepID=UPI0021B80C79|nr:TIGR04104 family putative zinc finger protein [Bacillus sp. Marseille-Q3570]
MPTCQNCHHEWTWRQTFKKQCRFNNKMTCPYCGEEQYISAKTRRNMVGYLVLVPFILLCVMAAIDFLIIDVPAMALYLSNVSVFAAMIFISPFFLEVTNTEEPLW